MASVMICLTVEPLWAVKPSIPKQSQQKQKTSNQVSGKGKSAASGKKQGKSTGTAKKNNTVELIPYDPDAVWYIFFSPNSSTIKKDQNSKIAEIAGMLKSNKSATLIIKGYTAMGGDFESNKKIAAARAESVRTQLVKKYGIAANRIVAEGEGIGGMFYEEESNNVAICYFALG